MAVDTQAAPSRSESWAESADDAKEKHPDSQADSLEKGTPSESDTSEHAPRRSIWKRALVGNVSAKNETKRAMQSRHLTMIGELS